jgi:hypothetical protein
VRTGSLTRQNGQICAVTAELQHSATGVHIGGSARGYPALAGL